ncbi:hypothetical protein D3C73_1506910 [compost metagenome]
MAHLFQRPCAVAEAAIATNGACAASVSLVHPPLQIIDQCLGHLAENPRRAASDAVVFHFCFGGEVADAAEQYGKLRERMIERDIRPEAEQVEGFYACR